MSFLISKISRLAIAKQASCGITIATALWLGACLDASATLTPEELELGSTLIESMLPDVAGDTSEADEREGKVSDLDSEEKEGIQPAETSEERVSDGQEAESSDAESSDAELSDSLERSDEGSEETAVTESLLEEETETVEKPTLPAQSHPRRLVLRLRERRVYVVEENKAITSFPVGIGKAGWETPTGQFKVMQKVPDPVWRHPWNGSLVPPGPNNPLGRHWIGFWSDGQNLIGFHGTIDESLIGQAVSHGCVRMKNADVAQLFSMVDEGMVVTVEH